jgi:ATP-dependent Zn protease
MTNAAASLGKTPSAADARCVDFLHAPDAGGSGGKAMGFGKSKAKLLTERAWPVTFDDVAGVDEAKEDLQEIVEFLRDPQKFQRLGGTIPRGVSAGRPSGHR